MIRIHDVENDEIIDREMTAEEFADFEAQQIALANIALSVSSAVAAKEALLDRLGLTAEEAKLLLS